MAQQVGCGYSVVLTDGGGFDGNAGKPALFHRRDDINIHILGKDVRLLVDAVGAQIGLVEHTDQGPGIGVRPGRVNLKVGAQGLAASTCSVAGRFRLLFSSFFIGRALSSRPSRVRATPPPSFS